MLSVDRIEENIAVCYDEDNKKYEIDIFFLPSDIKEGDIISEINGKYIVDRNATIKRREEISKLQDNLWK